MIRRFTTRSAYTHDEKQWRARLALRSFHRAVKQPRSFARNILLVVVVVAAASTVLVVVTAVPRYDNFTFIDRSGRTTYLSLSLLLLLPSFLSLSLSPGSSPLTLTQSVRSLSVYSARRVREIGGVPRRNLSGRVP